MRGRFIHRSEKSIWLRMCMIQWDGNTMPFAEINVESNSLPFKRQDDLCHQLRESLPHVSFSWSVLRNEYRLSWIKRAFTSAFRTDNVCSDVTASNLESRVHKKLSARPSISNEITLVSEMTIGLTVRLCGATGVIIRLPEFGKTMGPPQLSE